MSYRVRQYFLLAFIGLASGVWAQTDPVHTLSGYVEDAASGEKLIGAVLYEPTLQKGATTNRYGFFSLTLPEGPLQVVVFHIGYQSDTLATRLDQDVQLTIALQPTPLEMGTVQVEAERLDPIQEQSQMSVVQVPIRQIKNAPVLMGEVDVLKTLQLLPGVQSGAEGMSGLYVRGGSPDQNLILLDGAPVYNASHLFGFFSVFNANAIKNVQLTKAGFPARYGGRLSSVLEVDMKDGNMKTFEGEGSVGLIASQLTLQGPLRKDRTSFIVSARRTYIDLLIRPFLPSDEKGGYHFYDLNAKLNHIFSPESRVFLSLYSGDDRFWSDFKEDYRSGSYREEDSIAADFGWGNVTSTLRWNYLFGNQLFGNFTAIYSRYQLSSDVDDRTAITSDGERETESLKLRYLSGIRDWGLKADLDYLPNPTHYIRFGGSGTLHTYSPGAAHIKSDPADGAPEDTTLAAEVSDALEYSLYGEDDVQLTDRLKANVGLHTSGFLVNDEFYTSLQPRISMRYLLPSDWAVKASYALMRQYIHLLSNSTVGLPTDLWLPATERVRPQQSRQFGMGLARQLKDQYEFSVEGYYKTMTNLIEYREGASFLVGFGESEDWQDKVEIGRGWSYGAELFVQKKRGRTTGWIGYTLSWTKRRFAGLNQGHTYPYRYDRRHDAALVLTRQLTRSTSFSLTWVYGTGNAATLPVARYYNDDAVRGGTPRPYYLPYETVVYGDRNGYRMSAFHHLDFSFNFGQAESAGHGFSFGVYNAYNRKNPFFIYFDDHYDSAANARKFRAKQVSLFPLLPWINYRFKF
ncbi:MAG: TonB-dependent receptor plug domain-containing protein [Gemmatimonadetes bacterium]|nr:TonB-dependent receptor plug domain-containing protein [Gemmatimonadota bacterium]